jgi:endonuclease III
MTNFKLDDNGYFVDIFEVFERLDQIYEETDLGNKDDPFDELVYIVLSTRTREIFYQEAFERVRTLVVDWNQLPDTPIDDLVEAIGEAGLASKKARVIKRAASDIQDRAGEVTLRFIEDMDTKEAEGFLMSLHGIGVKMAKCVLMYSAGREVFPVDTHCLRVGARLGWLSSASRKRSRKHMQSIEDAVPAELRKVLHVRLVQHGRRMCTMNSPACHACVLNDLCEYAQQEELASSGSNPAGDPRA